MADYINNIAAADVYTPDLTLGPNFEATAVVITVANNPVLMQFAVGKYGSWRWTDEREFYSITQSFRVSNVIGVKFRNANPGQIARVLADLAGGVDDPIFESGMPFTGILSASGAISTGGSGVTGDIVWSAAAARIGAVLCDGTVYDGTNATYTPLWVALGSVAPQNAFAVPDLRDRVPLGAGGNTALLADDGVAAAERHGTRHRHTPHIHGIPAAAAGTTNAAGTATAAGSPGENTFAADGGSGVVTDPLDGPGFKALNAFILL